MTQGPYLTELVKIRRERAAFEGRMRQRANAALSEQKAHAQLSEMAGPRTAPRTERPAERRRRERALTAMLRLALASSAVRSLPSVSSLVAKAAAAQLTTLDEVRDALREIAASEDASPKDRRSAKDALESLAVDDAIEDDKDDESSSQKSNGKSPRLASAASPLPSDAGGIPPDVFARLSREQQNYFLAPLAQRSPTPEEYAAIAGALADAWGFRR